VESTVPANVRREIFVIEPPAAFGLTAFSRDCSCFRMSWPALAAPNPTLANVA
jgi:hypothetical protein